MGKKQKVDNTVYAPNEIGTPSPVYTPTKNDNHISSWDSPYSFDDKFYNVDVDSYKKYGVSMLPDDSANWDRERADGQSGWEQAGRAGSRLLVNTIPNLIGSVANSLDFETELSKETDFGNFITNAVQEFTKKNHLGLPSGTEDSQIYHQTNDQSFHMGDSAWWLENGEGLVESALAFAGGGMVTGAAALGTLTKGAQAAKWLSYLGEGYSEAMAANKGLKLGDATMRMIQAGAEASNAYLTTKSEGVGIATTVYKETYDKYKESLGDEGAKKLAAESAATTYKVNLLNTLTNFTSAAKLVRAGNFTRELIEHPAHAMWKEYAREMPQEFNEEIVNDIAQKAGEAHADKKEYGLSDALKYYTTEQAMQSGFWGAAGAGLQQSFTNILHRTVPTGEKNEGGDRITEYESALNRFNAQQESIKFHDNIQKENNLPTITNAFNSAAQNAQLSAKLTEAINKNDKKAIEDLQNTMFVNQVSSAMSNGTLESLENSYKAIGELSEEEAQKRGIHDGKTKPTDEGYYKNVVKKKLGDIKNLEDHFVNSTNFLNQREVFNNRAIAYQTKESMSGYESARAKQVNALQTKVDNAVNSGDLDLSFKNEFDNTDEPLHFGYDINELSPDKDGKIKFIRGNETASELAAKHKLIDYVENTPEKRVINTYDEFINKRKKELSALDTEHNDLISQKKQDELLKEKKAKEEEYRKNNPKKSLLSKLIGSVNTKIDNTKAKSKQESIKKSAAVSAAVTATKNVTPAANATNTSVSPTGSKSVNYDELLEKTYKATQAHREKKVSEGDTIGEDLLNKHIEQITKYHENLKADGNPIAGKYGDFLNQLIDFKDKYEQIKKDKANGMLSAAQGFEDIPNKMNQNQSEIEAADAKIKELQDENKVLAQTPGNEDTIAENNQYIENIANSKIPAYTDANSYETNYANNLVKLVSPELGGATDSFLAFMSVIRKRVGEEQFEKHYTAFTSLWQNQHKTSNWSESQNYNTYEEFIKHVDNNVHEEFKRSVDTNDEPTEEQALAIIQQLMHKWMENLTNEEITEFETAGINIQKLTVDVWNKLQYLARDYEEVIDDENLVSKHDVNDKLHKGLNKALLDKLRTFVGAKVRFFVNRDYPNFEELHNAYNDDEEKRFGKTPIAIALVNDDGSETIVGYYSDIDWIDRFNITTPIRKDEDGNVIPNTQEDVDAHVKAQQDLVMNVRRKIINGDDKGVETTIESISEGFIQYRSDGEYRLIKGTDTREGAWKNNNVRIGVAILNEKGQPTIVMSDGSTQDAPHADFLGMTFAETGDGKLIPVRNEKLDNETIAKIRLVIQASMDGKNPELVKEINAATGLNIMTFKGLKAFLARYIILYEGNESVGTEGDFDEYVLDKATQTDGDSKLFVQVLQNTEGLPIIKYAIGAVTVDDIKTIRQKTNKDSNIVNSTRTELIERLCGNPLSEDEDRQRGFMGNKTIKTNANLMKLKVFGDFDLNDTIPTSLQIVGKSTNYSNFMLNKLSTNVLEFNYTNAKEETKYTSTLQKSIRFDMNPFGVKPNNTVDDVISNQEAIKEETAAEKRIREKRERMLGKEKEDISKCKT